NSRWATPGNAQTNPNIGATSIIVSSAGQASYLWQQDGDHKTFNILDIGKQDVANNSCGPHMAVGENICWVAQRSESSSKNADFEIIAPKALVDANDGVWVSIVNACKSIKDSNGWEDHMYQSPNSSWGNTVSAHAIGQGGIDCGMGRPDDQDNLTLKVNPGSFSVGNYFGSGMEFAIVQVTDNSGNNTGKVLAASIRNTVNIYGAQVNQNGFYIGPVDDSSA